MSTCSTLVDPRGRSCIHRRMSISSPRGLSCNARRLSDKHGHLYGSDNGSFSAPPESASGGLGGSSETETAHLKPAALSQSHNFLRRSMFVRQPPRQAGKTTRRTGLSAGTRRCLSSDGLISQTARLKRAIAIARDRTRRLGRTLAFIAARPRFLTLAWRRIEARGQLAAAPPPATPRS